MRFSRRNLIKLAPISAAAMILGGCDSRYYRWKQKVTVVVTTPSGDKTGSAVSEVTAKLGFALGAAGTVAMLRVKGEATVVDLGGGKYLFALLDNNTQYLTEYAYRRAQDEGTEAYWARLENLKGQSVSLLSIGHSPMLVIFGNLNTPASVKEAAGSGLSSAFGSGYAVKSITLEMTDEPVTEGVVEKVLPWWCKYKNENRRLSGNNTIAIADNEFANNLGTGSFGTGECKP